MTNGDLVKKARSVAKPRKIKHGYAVGEVGCALVTEGGNVHLGVSIDTCSGMGFCAEHGAIASMLTHGENRIKRIVAVTKDGTALAPCGRCRELMHQVHEGNMDAEIIVGKGKAIKLRDLLPHPWDEGL
ncbi:MAG: cytidine deaminase [Candidatus Brockarchaeota archaeon]|nr:cytidine deaminase [Candidatus Brockarchaeota archaeon]